MKPSKSKRPAAARGRRLVVPNSGAVTLSAARLDKLGVWPGDALEVYSRQFATHKDIVLRILPHGFTPAEIARAERRTLRAIARERKAGRIESVPKRRKSLPP